MPISCAGYPRPSALGSKTPKICLPSSHPYPLSKFSSSSTTRGRFSIHKEIPRGRSMAWWRNQVNSATFTSLLSPALPSSPGLQKSRRAPPHLRALRSVGFGRRHPETVRLLILSQPPYWPPSYNRTSGTAIELRGSGSSARRMYLARSIRASQRRPNSLSPPSRFGSSDLVFESF